MRDQLSVRLPHELNASVSERAKRDARRPSDIVRLALQAYLNEPASGGRNRPDRAREGAGSPAWGKSEHAPSERSILLRKVPDALYRALEDRAARERLSAADYVLDILARRQFRERLQSRPRVRLGVSAAELIRQERDSR